MKRLLSLASIFVVASAASLSAQDLYSQAVGTGNAMRITIKMRQGNPGSTYSIAIASGSTIGLIGPGSVTTDVNGYAAAVFRATGSIANSNPESLSITFTDFGGPVVRKYLLKSTNSRLASAWPDFLGLEGVFCNPPANAATHLQIERFADLDGDGLYGDTIVENSVNGLDALDSPGEMSSDVNGTGTGCVGGVAPNVYQPGGSGRQVAFIADARIVNGPCDFTSEMNFLRDLSYGMFNGVPTVLATGSGADTAVIFRDTNGDGTITASEIGTLFDPSAVVNNENYSPDGIAIDPTAGNRAYWISDKSGALGSPANQGLFRLTDTNGNNVIGTGEFVHSLTGTTPTVVVESITVDTTEFEGLHCDSTGAVLVNDTSLGTIFRWVDGNQNGVAETGEVSNWLTYNTASSYTVSWDFQNGASFPAISGTYWAFNRIESAATPAGEITFVASTNSSGNDAGYIFRCEDINQNGTVNDQGEVTVFVDPALQTDPVLGAPYNWTSGMGVAAIDINGNGNVEDSEVYVYGANPNGPTPNCGYPFADLQFWRFHDANGNGSANDAGDAERVAIHPTGAFNRGLELVPAGAFRQTFYARSTLQTIQAANCLTGGGAYLELDYLRHKLEEGTQGTPFSGNQRFELVSRGNSASSFGGLLIAPTEVNPPFSLGFLSTPCTLGVIGPPDINLMSFSAPVGGELNFPFPVPAGFSSVSIYLQPYNLDFSFGLVLGEVTRMDIN